MMRFCKNCERNVEFKRKIGAGTFIIILLTGGLWILAIPFYPKRCNICGGTAHSKKV